MSLTDDIPAVRTRQPPPPLTGSMEHYACGVAIKRAVIKTPQSIIDELVTLRDLQLSKEYDFDGDVATHKHSGIVYHNKRDILEQPTRVHPHGRDGSIELSDFTVDDYWFDVDRLCYLAVLEYIQKYPTIITSLWWKNRGHVLVYEPRAFLSRHQDQDIGYTYDTRENVIGKHEISTRNVISTTMHIADCEGGEMYFPYADLTVEAREGDIILFPANYLGSHEITPVAEGNRRLSYLQFFGQGSMEALTSAEEGLAITEPREGFIDPFMWCPTIRGDFLKYSSWTAEEVTSQYPAFGHEGTPKYSTSVFKDSQGLQVGGGSPTEGDT